MKQRFYMLWYTSFIFGVYSLNFGSCIVTPATRRAWDVASTVLTSAFTIDSKISSLINLVQSDYSSTFTALRTLQIKVNTVASVVYSIDSVLDQTSSDMDTILSKADALIQDANIINQKISTIHVNDFGGTWTALNALQSTLSSSFDVVIRNLITIESQIDRLNADNQAQFIATSTNLQRVLVDVFATMTTAQTFSDQIAADLTNIDSLIDATARQLMTTDSKVGVINANINTGFAGTFTLIQSISTIFSEVNSELAVLQRSLINAFNATFTTVDYLNGRANTINSELDTMVIEVSTIQGQASTLNSNIDVANRSISTVDSKLDQLTSRNDGLGSLVSNLVIHLVSVESKAELLNIASLLPQALTVESRVDVLGRDVQTVNSKINILDSRDNVLQSVLDYAFHRANTSFSKLTVLDSEIDIAAVLVVTIGSKLDRIYTINSKVDRVDSITDVLALQWSTITSKVERMSSTVDLVAQAVLTTGSVVDRIFSVVDGSQAVLYTTNSLVNVISSSLDLIQPESISIASKLSVVESKVGVIDSKLDIVTIGLNNANVNAVERAVDFQETWTIINALQRSLLSTQSRADLVSNTLSGLRLTIDQSSTYTAIAALSSQETSIESRVDRIQNALNAINVLSYKSSFTVMNEILTNLQTVNSLIDSLSITVTTLSSDAFECTGVPIYQSNFSSGTYNITSPGYYYLAEDINIYSEITTVISINTDNVSLNLNGKSIFGHASVTRGVGVATTRSNIAIFNGRIADIIRFGIEILGGSQNILLEDIITQYVGVARNGVSYNSFGDGNNIRTPSTNVRVRNVIVENVSNDGWDIEGAAVNHFLENLRVLNAGDGGIDYPGPGAANCVLRGCSVDATRRGISTTGARFLIDNCRATGVVNGGGIALIGTDALVRNSTVERCPIGISAAGTGGHVIINCDITQNTGNGIANTSANNIIMFNRLINNGTNIGGAGVGTILGNYALNLTGVTNYNISGTVITGALSTIQNTKAFPATTPTYWYNISAIP